jgi:CRP/FNR family transcriptional regulator
MVCRLCLPEWLPAVQAHKKHFDHKKGDVLFREGEPVKGIYFLYKGKVKVHKHWDEGKELIVRFAKEGDIVGHRGIGADLVYPVTATALEPVTVCYFDMEFFNASLKVSHHLLYELMLFYAKELQESEKRMRNLAHMPVKGRLANALITLQEKFGHNKDGSIAFPLNRQDLAAYIGATYETTFRMLNALVEEGLVAVSGKSIAITQQEKLDRLRQQA